MPPSSPLPPLIASALAEPGSLSEVLGRIARHSPGRGRYTVLGELAAGGMGRVLRVWDEDLQRELAMKVVPLAAPDGADQEQRAAHRRRLERFLEEARIAGQLDHPGIVPVHELGSDGEGSVYFTMPLVRGRTFADVIALMHAGTGAWTLHRALGVLHRVFQTAAFAHSKGIVHRDLKPENVLVGPFGEAYVVDWGLARILERGTSGEVVGTPAYMAPEQASGRTEEVGPRSDVYSLGAILYELLGGTRPHALSLSERARGEGGSEAGVAAMLAAPPRPLSVISSDAPAPLVAICEKAMAAAPERRYASAQSLADDLQAWLEDRVVGAYRTGPLARLETWSRRNRALARALSALLVVLFAGTVLGVVQMRWHVRAVEAHSRATERKSYLANLVAANLSLRALEVEDAQRRLAACPVELRGWEWEHLRSVSDASRAVWRGHAGPVRSVAAAPDGSLLASASDDGTAVLWRPGGAIARRLGGHRDEVSAVCFSPDGELVGTASEDGALRLWRIEGGEPARTLQTDERLRALAFAPDGSLVAAGGAQGTVFVTPLMGDEAPTELEAPGPPVFALSFHPSGPVIASGHGEGRVRVRDARTGGRIAERLLTSQRVTALAHSPDGATLAAGIGSEVHLVDAATLATRAVLRGHEGTVQSLAFHPRDGLLLCGSYDGSVRLFDPSSGSEVARFLGHADGVHGIAWLSSGRFASASEDHTVRLWDLVARTTLVLRGHRGWVTTLAFDDTGERLATGGRDATLRVWDARREPLELARAPAGVDTLVWLSSDELAFGCGRPGILAGPARSGASWSEIARVHGFPRELLRGPEGSFLARSSEGTLHLFGLDGRDGFDRIGGIEAMALHPGGERLAVGRADGSIGIHDLASGTERLRLRASPRAPGAAEPLTALAFSPDGELLCAGTRAAAIEIWGLAGRRRLLVLEGHEHRVNALAFHPREERLASASEDGTVRLWDPRSGDQLLVLRSHAGAILDLAFSPCGAELASASKDGTVRLWRSAARAGGS